MPFTLSHPAAILPLLPRGGRLVDAGVGSALVVGSMAPDLPYFTPLGVSREVTHTLASVIWFSVPAGLVAWLAFQHLMKAPALFLLPRPFRTRIDPAAARLRPLAVPVALAAGALTHVIWDAITHETGAAVRGIPVLQTLAGDARGVRLWTFHLLQHGSTLGGAVALALWTRAWLRRTPPRPERPASDLPAARASDLPAARTTDLPAARATDLPAARATDLPAAWRGPLRGAVSLAPPALGFALALAMVPLRADLGSAVFFLSHVAVAWISSAALLLLGVGLVARLRHARAGA